MMRRAILIVALILIAITLGAATTFGIAWALAYWESEPYSGIGEIGWSHPDGDAWMVRRWDARGSTQLHAKSATNWVAGGKQSFDDTFVPRWSGLHERPQHFNETHYIDARGWPLRAMIQVRIQRTGAPAEFLHMYEVNPPKSRPRNWRSPTITLPTKPLWTGFLANTAIYGSIWLLVFLTPICLFITSRRWWRRSRGRCPLCAYDLRHNLARGCSECGWRRGASD